MREWIAYIIFMNPRLDKLCASIEKKIKNIALDMGKPAHKGIYEIDALDKLKRRLINLRVMHTALVERLSADELMMFKNKESFRNLNRVTLHRLRCRAIKKAAFTLEGLGFNEEKMIKEYGHVQ